MGLHHERIEITEQESRSFEKSAWKDRARSVRMSLNNLLKARADGIRIYEIKECDAHVMRATLAHGGVKVLAEAGQLIGLQPDDDLILEPEEAMQIN